MLSHIAERNLVAIRLALLSGWLALIGHLLMNTSVGRVRPVTSAIVVDSIGTHCIQVQAHCVLIHPDGHIATLFWGIIVPASVLILLVFGHVTWRRICPLSLVSQIPRLLGWQRLDTNGNPIRITSDHWISRYHSYIQFGFLFIGLCLRLLILNADSGWLGLWFLFTIACALTIGFLYAGKSWCHYICPMAPVQKIFAEPLGLFTRKAHIQSQGQSQRQSQGQSQRQSQRQSVTQSMCRTTTDRSACTACTSNCMDIDAEKSYWESIDRPETKWLYYSYLGLVLGFFGSFYLYAGNWDYYFSGVWSRESTLLQDLWRSGLYFLPSNLYIPKLISIPGSLMMAVLFTYTIGLAVENVYLSWHDRHDSVTNPAILTHRLYTIWTVIAFNLFFGFAGRPCLFPLPDGWRGLSHGCLTLSVFGMSSLWGLRTWRRSPDRYARERRSSRWLKRLHHQKIDLRAELGGRSIYALNWEEFTTLRQRIQEIHPDPAERIDRAFLQTLIEDSDQSFTGRWTRDRNRLIRRGWIALAAQHLPHHFPHNPNLPPEVSFDRPPSHGFAPPSRSVILRNN